MELNYWFVKRCYSVTAGEHNNSTTSEIQLDGFGDRAFDSSARRCHNRCRIIFVARDL